MEILTVMVGRMHLEGIEEQAAFLVADKGVVIPAVPQLEHDIGIFRGAFVSLLGRQMLRLAKVGRLLLVGAGDEIPADPAAAEVIEGRDHARDREWRGVGRVDRRHEPDALGHHRQRAEQHPWSSARI